MARDPEWLDPVVNRYWVDIARRGLILKHAEIVSGRTSAEMTITYKDDAQSGWVPASWEGRCLKSPISASVLKFTLNKPIAADLFAIEYPPGTVVFDQDQRKQWRILADGTKEQVVSQKSAK